LDVLTLVAVPSGADVDRLGLPVSVDEHQEAQVSVQAERRAKSFPALRARSAADPFEEAARRGDNAAARGVILLRRPGHIPS
jgi:hypothetical protein